eukprot:TRINITY_DN4242_c0_g1_i2.p1 TRINITY_DN4242_c0_g1~~TRINITY_DN4242_c0_g1_i2.p1  ORF type:complete len:108 (-),score=15.30 TRINITY_DN4242_c0_g1_i2:18-341(-)
MVFLKSSAVLTRKSATASEQVSARAVIHARLVLNQGPIQISFRRQVGHLTRGDVAVSYTHLRAHETPEHLVCRLLLEKKKKQKHADSIRVTTRNITKTNNKHGQQKY